MTTPALIILLSLCAVFSCAVMIVTHREEKRGCGRGCATCPNKKMCHRKRKKAK